MKKINLLILKYFFSIITITVIIVLSLIKTDKITPSFLFGIENLDKVVHIIMYFSLTTILLLEIYSNKNIKKIERIQLFLFSSTVGISLEISQKLFTSTRSFAISDIIANSLGVLIAIIIYSKLI